ncbi:MarR family winged helix-turn-helix transcriptional regulator [Chryseosolibacter indicus]|uniref:MarR family transcriptional regulator n=1 Tax=Chryseosolibacter indicus TaxID=2782351 RepID=A0ABS5VPG7_9BACT|nr:MarR family transcriptional regulator [Chryseosolibacter indicus]MBT1703308.1 MarR family transcriptional regulator [Chryseosolibacter indicus]
MSLSQDIKQKEFRSEYQKAILNILYTHNYLITHMSDAFKDFDITRQQFNVLRILRGQYPKPATVNLIKDRMLDKMSDTSRIVERLRLKGLINREDSKNDKRAVEITITESGLELLEKMEGPVDNLEKLLYNLSEDETRQLNTLLDKMRGSQLDESEIAHEELLNQQEKF